MSNQQESPFLNLPRELRDTIYNYSVADKKLLYYPLIDGLGHTNKFNHINTNLLLACRQIHQEASEILCGKHFFEILDPFGRYNFEIPRACLLDRSDCERTIANFPRESVRLVSLLFFLPEDKDGEYGNFQAQSKKLDESLPRLCAELRRFEELKTVKIAVAGPKHVIELPCVVDEKGTAGELLKRIVRDILGSIPKTGNVVACAENDPDSPQQHINVNNFDPANMNLRKKMVSPEILQEVLNKHQRELRGNSAP